MSIVTVIGAGLAGCEVAWALACRGIKVKLYEMKPLKFSPAHSYNGFAELVCSNSFKAIRRDSASGLLKEEMRKFGSIILQAADTCTVPAGEALSVNRNLFSDYVTQMIKTHNNIEVVNFEVSDIPETGYVVIATGPLTSDKLSDTISNYCGVNQLHFYDAAAPIIAFESIDNLKVFSASRYNKGSADYINCPMNEMQYKKFYDSLVSAETVELKEFENQCFRVYEGCMPIEVMAKRGFDTLRFGPLKPVGLVDPSTGLIPNAVVQLRKETSTGSMYNLVGFQTNLKFNEQKRVFSLIPGLENAEYIRYGVMHRNTFIDSPKLLDNFLRLKSNNRIFFAGQITGVEGYMESAATGIYIGYIISMLISNKNIEPIPSNTMIGSLIRYLNDTTIKNFQPMGCNMGLLPDLTNRIKDKKVRYLTLSNRSLSDIDSFLANQNY